MKYFRTYNNSKAKRIVNDIIKTEQLEVEVSCYVDAIGDDIIEVYGENEEIDTLQGIFEMVA